MSEKRSEEEPSIEEILASIRQIISDDDDEEVVEDDDDEPEEELVPVEDNGDDVLELTEDDLVNDDYEPEEEDSFDIEMRDRPEPEPEPIMQPKRETVPSDILSSATQSAALSSLSKLATKMPIERSRSYDGVTLEDIVRELLHPMLREWMDDNLPPMVERIVQKELEKLARRAMDD